MRLCTPVNVLVSITPFIDLIFSTTISPSFSKFPTSILAIRSNSPNRGWAEVQSFKKKKGKGRPIHIYKATMPLSQVMEEIEQEKTKEIEAVKDNMSELKNIFNNR